jgi:hypothetical protein
MLVIAAAIFALLFAFVACCDRLVARPEEEIEES